MSLVNVCKQEYKKKMLETVVVEKVENDELEATFRDCENQLLRNKLKQRLCVLISQSRSLHISLVNSNN